MISNHSPAGSSVHYAVVVNDERQYSIWPDHQKLPSGWHNAGKTGPKAECLAFIKQVWTDMRPLSVTRKMEESAKTPTTPALLDAVEPQQKSLVERLCQGDHLVEVGIHPEKTLKLFKESIDRQHVHIKFVQTKGGTEIGFHLDQDTLDLGSADFEAGQGNIHMEGSVTLDYVKVKCVADIDLSTLQGKAHIVRIDVKDKITV